MPLRRISACLAILAGSLLNAEIIDRMAISVANQVITEGEIEEQIRLAAFLNREQPDLSIEQKKKAAGRLVEQALVKRDMELSHYPIPPLTEASDALAKVKALYPDAARYQQALKQYAVTEDGLQRWLWWQLTFLRFTDYRFRSAIQISDAEIQTYYQQQVPKWREQRVNPIPSLEDTRESIAEILTQQKIDQALEKWLEDTRKQVSVKYLDETLQ